MKLRLHSQCKRGLVRTQDHEELSCNFDPGGQARASIHRGTSYISLKYYVVITTGNPKKARIDSAQPHAYPRHSSQEEVSGTKGSCRQKPARAWCELADYAVHVP